MNFKDIDFSKVASILNSMSDEEKENLQKMAQDMMHEKEEEAEEETDFFEFLQIQEEDYTNLPGTVLDQMEAAADLEQYYEEDMDADFSGSVLFYAKAMLNVLRKYHYEVYRDVLNLSQSVSTTTLYSFLAPLMQEGTIRTLVDAGHGTMEDWIFHRDSLQNVAILLSRAEYDRVGFQEVQMLKDILFNKKAILNAEEVI